MCLPDDDALGLTCHPSPQRGLASPKGSPIDSDHRSPSSAVASLE